MERCARLQVVSSTLAACRHQTCFLNRDAGASRARAGRIEIRPDLVGAVSTDGIGGRPARFGEGNRFVCLHVRSNHRQGKHGHSEKRENRERSEGFDHLGLLTVAERQSRCARGSIDNTGEDVGFRGCQPLFGCLSQASRGNLHARTSDLSAGGHAEAALHRTPLGDGLGIRSCMDKSFGRHSFRGRPPQFASIRSTRYAPC